MYAAVHDIMIYLEDNRFARDIISKNLVDYQEINGGHIVFMVGKN
mgnify:CR=1 FL=1